MTIENVLRRPKHALQLNKKPINISSDDFAQNVHEYFAWMREESPVYKARLSRGKDAYLIMRYEDVVDAIKDPRVVKNPNNAKPESGRNGMYWMPKVFRPLMNNMLNSDEPDHRRLRNLVHKAFTPRMIEALAPRIESIAHELLDAAQQKQSIDLIQEYALPLPITVIAEMIGVPKEDRQKFRTWTERILVSPTPFNMLRAVPAVTSLLKYTRKLADKRRVDPQEDLLTALVQAEDEGDRFTEDELLGMVFLLLVAGHETTVGLIASGTLALLTNPDQLALLKSDWCLIDSAVEELLRFDGPLQTTEMSFARKAFSLHGIEIPQGATVLPAILSANRDEHAFKDADKLDITRTPNRHLAFGQGIHYCLGAPLARLEGKLAFRTLLERCPELQLAVQPDEIRFKSIVVVHRPLEVPVRLA